MVNRDSTNARGILGNGSARTWNKIRSVTKWNRRTRNTERLRDIRLGQLLVVGGTCGSLYEAEQVYADTEDTWNHPKGTPAVETSRLQAQEQPAHRDWIYWREKTINDDQSEMPCIRMMQRIIIKTRIPMLVGLTWI